MALRRDEALALSGMGLAFLVVMPLAVWFARPFQADRPAGLPQDPTRAGDVVLLVLGAVAFVLLAIAMAAFIIWAVRTGRQRVLKILMHAAVATALLVVLARPAMVLVPALGPDLPWLLALALAGGLTVWLYLRPHPTLLNAIGLLVAAAVAGLAGAVLGVVPLLVLLVAIAVYDQFAVRHGHMQKLARAAVDLRLPVAIQFGSGRPARRATVDLPLPPETMRQDLPAQGPPEAKKRSGADSPPDAGGRPKGGFRMFVGLGDFVFPTSLVVAASDPRHGWGVLPAVLAGAGILVGYAVLVRVALKGKAQPGLPLLNAGAILGLFAGLALATGSLRAW